VCTNRAVDQIDHKKIGLGESQRERERDTHIYIYIYTYIYIYIYIFIRGKAKKEENNACRFKQPTGRGFHHLNPNFKKTLMKSF